MQMPWRNATSCLHFCACLAQLKTTCLVGTIPSGLERPTSINHSSRNVCIGLPVGQSDGGIFSFRATFSQKILAYFKLTKT